MATQSKSMQALWQDSYLSSGNESYLEGLYESYLNDRQSVSPEWRNFFDQLPTQGRPGTADVSHANIREAFKRLATQPLAAAGMQTVHDSKQAAVDQLIEAYRRFGHLKANIDPLGLDKRVPDPRLDLSYYGLTSEDLSKSFNTTNFSALQSSTATLAAIVDALEVVYCGTIGFEYAYIDRHDEVAWLRARIENGWAHFDPSPEVKRRILERLVVADGLEKYLGFKYVGQKRFSLEGGDSLIPLLDTLINQGVQTGLKEAVIGMAHRGRLNVLVNVVGQSPKDIFAAFEGKSIQAGYSGDVKYHLGYAADVVTPGGVIHVALAFNPSHLEIVSPVVQGSVRARQRRRHNTDQQQVMPIQIHGDAAFSGQGVVMETFCMSQARWFTVGGSVHIVINNQVGFTTSDKRDARSTVYCTDIAKMVAAPILHVNGNDPEAAYYAALLAIEYRQQFKRDIVIDLVCYRRHGHNEADEPSATQPMMYKVIKAMRTPAALYAEKLRQEGLIDDATEKQLVNDYRNALDEGKNVVTVTTDKEADEFKANWQPYIGTRWNTPVKTGVPLKQLQTLARALEKLPEGFVVQPQVKKTLEMQKKMTEGEMPINWGYAETLAYATLLDEGYPIRLCGQDAGRGTFAHRHAVLHDQMSDEVYIPLGHVAPNQAQINVIDSLLSEEAVLAFEYGYAATAPHILTLWEAQFGDFANGAQVVIDQFISAGEQKWQRLCGLVMLLPHGFEGQGPEHSSARLERYLQLCAQDNMQVCVPSTPAQIFHLLRRQMLRPYRKPLIVMTPKSLLRNPNASSSLQDLVAGEFQLIIPEVAALDTKKTDRVIFCCGKIYYELLEKRRELGCDHVALLRVEQLYPFPDAACKEALKPYQHVKDIIWCQEEPENQGAWIKLQPDLLSHLKKDQRLRYVGRPASASPAVGYHSVHEKEQQQLVAEALMK